MSLFRGGAGVLSTLNLDRLTVLPLTHLDYFSLVQGYVRVSGQPNRRGRHPNHSYVHENDIHRLNYLIRGPNCLIVVLPWQPHNHSSWPVSQYQPPITINVGNVLQRRMSTRRTRF
jgi:hypothetical protein